MEMWNILKCKPISRGNGENEEFGGNLAHSQPPKDSETLANRVFTEFHHPRLEAVRGK